MGYPPVPGSNWRAVVVRVHRRSCAVRNSRIFHQRSRPRTCHCGDAGARSSKPPPNFCSLKQSLCTRGSTSSMQPTTLAQILVNGPSKGPAVIGDSPDLALTYEDLIDQTERLAGRMRAAGLQAGDSVAVVLPNGPAFVTIILALMRAGLVAAPFNSSFTTNELRALLNDLQPRAIIVDDTSSAVVHGAAATDVPVWTVAVDASGVVSVSGLALSSRRVPEEPAPDDPALLLDRKSTRLNSSHAN